MYRSLLEKLEIHKKIKYDRALYSLPIASSVLKISPILLKTKETSKPRNGHEFDINNTKWRKRFNGLASKQSHESTAGVLLNTAIKQTARTGRVEKTYTFKVASTPATF